MKVTFVLPFAGLQGGVRVVATYADRLARRGHEVVVISTPPEVSLRSRAKSLMRGRGWRFRPEPSHFDGLNVEHRILEQIRPVVDADVPDGDVVVATFYTTAYGVQHLSRSKGAKAIFIQNYEVKEGEVNPKLDATWRMPMHKITISKWLVQLAREKFADSVVSLVPNSVDLQQFHAAERGKRSVPTVGMLYSTFSMKGCDTSLKALKRVATTLPSIRLVSFGAEQPDFRLPLPRFTEFHHRPPQEKLREIYAQCDVWLSASYLEGFCLPLLEAMACRCPVVSTRSGGPLDIVEEGTNGYLVDVKDVDGLADRTLRVLNLPQKEWQRMSEAAYRTAARYTLDDATDLFEQALQLAIKRSKGGELEHGRRVLSPHAV